MSGFIKGTVDRSMSDYAVKCSYRPNAILDKLQKHTAEKVEYSRMMGDSQVLQLLANLVKSIGAKKTLEIGTFTGSSALAIAQVLPEGGKVVAMDVSDEWTNVGKPFWEEAGVRHKIDLRIAPALESLNGLLKNGEEGTFDFAFIDADKDNQTEYYQLCMKLVRSGGIIAIDNTLWGGKAANPQANDPMTQCIKSCNETVKNDPRVSPVMLVMGDGLTLVFKH